MSTPEARTFGRAVTIKDVARLSDVSPATVTRVVRGRGSVSEETRRRVEESVRILGYRPDHIARALVTRLSSTVGLLLPSSGDSFWGEVAAGIEERASEASYSVLFANAHGSNEREHAMIELFLSRRVDGLIFAGAAGDPQTWFDNREPRVPVVLVNWDATFRPQDLEAAAVLPAADMATAVSREASGGDGLSHIVFDDPGGVALLVEHLLALNHTRVAFVGGTSIRPTLLRILGFRQALESAGLRPGAIVGCEESLEAGRDAALSILSGPNPPTAVVAYSDLVAIGAMRAVHALGKRVPEDVSVVGFNDIDVAAFVEPPLTTVRQPMREMGRLAMEWILDSLAGRPMPKHQAMPGVLVVRGSTGPATGRGGPWKPSD
jgi:DNA-binding LacI/PurR family transcriptional regulator